MYKSCAQVSGYNLRKVKYVAAKDKISTGANGIGQLTKDAIESIQDFIAVQLQ